MESVFYVAGIITFYTILVAMAAKITLVKC